MTLYQSPKVRYAAFERNAGKNARSAKNGLREQGLADLLDRMLQDSDKRVQRLAKRVG